MMKTYLIAFILVTALLLMPLHASLAAQDAKSNPTISKDSELPAALSEDDSFNDLPFEQLRQALREEVEQNPERRRTMPSPRKYNLLIR